MLTWRQIGAEITKALAVLALVLFALGITPAWSGAGAAEAGYAHGTAAPQIVFCGGAPDERACHGPCHACRFGLAVLPPPPSEADVAFGPALRVALTPAPVAPVIPAEVFPAYPRAPPETVCVPLTNDAVRASDPTKTDWRFDQ